MLRGKYDQHDREYHCHECNNDHAEAGPERLLAEALIIRCFYFLELLGFLHFSPGGSQLLSRFVVDGNKHGKALRASGGFEVLILCTAARANFSGH